VDLGVRLAFALSMQGRAKAASLLYASSGLSNIARLGIELQAKGWPNPLDPWRISAAPSTVVSSVTITSVHDLPRTRILV